MIRSRHVGPDAGAGMVEITGTVSKPLMALLINPEFSCLPPDLARLFAAAGEESFFNHPAWYAVFARHALDPGAEVRLYADAAAGAALLLQVPQSSGTRRQVSLTNYYSCAHAPLVRSGVDGAAGLSEIVGTIFAERPRWNCVSLAGLDPTTAEFAALATALRRAGRMVRPFFDFGVWYQATSGLSFARYHDGLPAQLRNTWQRKRKKLTGGGRLHLAFSCDGAGLEQNIADYETIYRASWKVAEPDPDFMPALMRACAAVGALRLAVYHLDGEPAAAQLWIVWRGRATIFKLAHDERFSEYSLGTLLTMELMERILEIDRPFEIDFGRGDDPYKKLWLPQRRERWGLLAANPRTARGLALSLREAAAGLFRRASSARPRRG